METKQETRVGRKRKSTYKYARGTKSKRFKGRSIIWRGPLQRQLKTGMVYAETFDLNPGSGGAAAVYMFSCNGLFDPNITSTGHQPRGFDQLMALYDHYTVIHAKINWFFGTTNASVYDQMAVISIEDDATVSASAIDYLERGNAVMTSFAAGASGETRRLTHQVNPAKFLGRSHPLSDSQLKGSDAANPTEQCYFHCAVFPMQNVDAATVNCTAVIEYVAILTEPNDVGQS